MIASTRLSTASSAYTSAIALARAEAARRGVRVSVCAGTLNATTKEVETGNDACNTTAGPTLWNQAYLVFAETKSGGTLGQYETGDTLIRAESLPTGIFVTTSFSDTSISVFPSGSISVGGTMLVCLSGQPGREITIKRTGTPTSKPASAICP